MEDKKGKLSEEEVIKEFLCLIEESLENDTNIFKKAHEKLHSTLNQLRLKNYTFNNSSLRELPIQIIEDNYNKLSKYVMELPQKIVDSIDEIKGFIIVVDEFQLLKTLENPEAFFC